MNQLLANSEKDQLVQETREQYKEIHLNSSMLKSSQDIVIHVSK
ncbi:7133_t:CDS:1 [Cetraspora pellucida]|uniref:7133_t:CDS:1 n=1 Tax=Cetraspora pellucida TaxID=1433469 RepID=A0A9N9IS92_9GLOM|nr:7133_t:CDS:1 [Cetraspora pellucida]